MKDIPVMLCIWGFFINHDALKHIFRHLFCRISILFILVKEVDAQTGQAYVISGPIIEVYRNRDDLI